MIARLPRWDDRRVARYLVAWWALSITAIVGLVANYALPTDVRFDWLSFEGARIVTIMTASLMIPGFLLGGWKALLVAAGRSSIRSAKDKGLIIAFSVWAIAWPLTVVSSLRAGLL